MPAQASVAVLLQQIGAADKYVAVEVNADLIPRRQHGEHTLAEDDEVEVVTLVGGG